MPVIVQQVGDLDDPRCAPYRNLRDAHLRGFCGPSHDGLFMAEGHLVIDHLIRSPYRVHSVLGANHRLEAIPELLARLPAGTPVLGAGKALLNEIVGFDIHRGLLAAGVREASPSLSAVAAGARCVVVLEGLSNHDNVGAVFRNVAALAGQAGAVVLDSSCCDPLYRKALRVSMGHALTVPFAWAVARDAIAALREARFETWAMSPAGAPIPETHGDRVAIVLGAEGPGLEEKTRASCDRAVGIRMAPGVDSLNVATSCGIVLSRLGFV